MILSERVQTKGNRKIFLFSLMDLNKAKNYTQVKVKVFHVSHKTRQSTLGYAYFIAINKGVLELELLFILSKRIYTNRNAQKLIFSMLDLIKAIKAENNNFKVSYVTIKTGWFILWHSYFIIPNKIQVFLSKMLEFMQFLASVLKL